MRVRVQSRLDIRVPEPLGHDLRMHAGAQQQRRVGVPQLVKVQRIQIRVSLDGLRDALAPLPRELRRIVWTTVPIVPAMRDAERTSSATRELEVVWGGQEDGLRRLRGISRQLEKLHRAEHTLRHERDGLVGALRSADVSWAMLSTWSGLSRQALSKRVSPAAYPNTEYAETPGSLRPGGAWQRRCGSRADAARLPTSARHHWPGSPEHLS